MQGFFSPVGALGKTRKDRNRDRALSTNCITVSLSNTHTQTLHYSLTHTYGRLLKLRCVVVAIGDSDDGFSHAYQPITLHVSSLDLQRVLGVFLEDRAGVMLVSSEAAAMSLIDQ